MLVSVSIMFLGSGVLTDGSYELKLDKVFGETLLTVDHDIGLRRSMLNENSTCLWHKRLGYIYKERLKRLSRDMIPQNLDLIDPVLCVDCVKGLQTTHNKKEATRSA